MLHVDIPSRAQIERLITHRESACVSIYLPTTPVTPDAQADRIAFGNLAKTALDQLAQSGMEKRGLEAIGGHLDGLAEDDDFWAFQAHSLAVFVTVGRVMTFRLANRLQPTAQVADRFHVKPLLRAVTASHHAYVLALSQDSARLVEVTGDFPAGIVKVPDMPQDMSDAVGRGSLQSRSPRGRLTGSEGKKVRIDQYARAVDNALREFLHGKDTPLILATTQPLDGIFRAVCTYPHLAQTTIEGNPQGTSETELAHRSRAILDQLHHDDVQEFAALFSQRTGQGRTTTDVGHAARAATFGAVAMLAVDIDETIPGTIGEEDGSVTLADGPGADSHGVVDEIAGRAYLSGARILALRRADIPGGGSLAAILRYPLP